MKLFGQKKHLYSRTYKRVSREIKITIPSHIGIVIEK